MHAGKRRIGRPRCNIQGLFKCRGRCGALNCSYTTDVCSSLRQHLRLVPRKKKKCVVCGKLMLVRSILKHMHRKHPHHTATPTLRKQPPCPYPDNRSGWNFIMRNVWAHVARDYKRQEKWSAADAEIIVEQYANYYKRRELARLVYQKWQSMTRGCDDAGGVLSDKLLLQPYSLFQLSLDRKDNTRPHFVNDGLSNVYFVALGINTAANIVSRWGGNTCQHLKDKVSESHSVQPSQIETLISRCSLPVRYSAVKRSGKRIFYKDKLCRAAFESCASFMQYAIHLFSQQRGFCAVSNIFMDEDVHTRSNDALGTATAFQPSLDAIEPRLGHVRGNLRWVCRFLNSVNASKRNVYAEMTTPTSWTRSIFYRYIGISEINTAAHHS